MAPRKCAAPSLVRISLGPAATPLTSAFLVLLVLLELLPFSLSLLLTFGIVSGSDLQACNLRALTGPQWPPHRVSAGSRLVNYKSFCINA
jgi:hypothetical protein